MHVDSQFSSKENPSLLSMGRAHMRACMPGLAGSDACCLVTGRFPALERMSFYRVIPSQHLLPAQLRSVTLQEIRPPYNSELGSEVGTFYLVHPFPTFTLCDQQRALTVVSARASMAFTALCSEHSCSGWD